MSHQERDVVGGFSHERDGLLMSQMLSRTTVDGQDSISDFQTGLERRAILEDIGDTHTRPTSTVENMTGAVCATKQCNTKTTALYPFNGNLLQAWQSSR